MANIEQSAEIEPLFTGFSLRVDAKRERQSRCGGSENEEYFCALEQEQTLSHPSRARLCQQHVHLGHSMHDVSFRRWSLLPGHCRRRVGGVATAHGGRADSHDQFLHGSPSWSATQPILNCSLHFPNIFALSSCPRLLWLLYVTFATELFSFHVSPLYVCVCGGGGSAILFFGFCGGSAQFVCPSRLITEF